MNADEDGTDCKNRAQHRRCLALLLLLLGEVCSLMLKHSALFDERFLIISFRKLRNELIYHEGINVDPL